ncbi:Penicillin-binding transpeptidase (fragment) [uncultured Alphaproteobacteria bacterium]|uniref:Penicillin-binding transpeptidase n=1 Tax=uncultured Alphaproteobacteria bacterium TaxID=91750 RepID=A0A212K8P9_9PROT
MPRSARPKANPPQRRAPARRAAPPPRKSGGLVGILKRWWLAALIWAALAVGAYLVWCAYGLPDVDAAAREPRRPAMVVEAADGRVLASYGDLHGGYVDIDRISPHLVHALLATEDRSFYHHFGVNPLSVARAMWVNYRAGAVRQGGSTVTQQVAKNLFLSPERTIRRKVQELLLSFWLEAKFSKDQILALYFNRVYFGGGTYGIEAAARRFYGVSAKNVDLYQAAALVGALKAPSRYNPLSNPENSDGRARQVLANMADAGYLSEAEAKRVPRRWAVRSTGGAGYFSDWILDAVGDRLGPADRDLWVRTTLDPRAQRIAEEALAATLDREGARHKVREGAVVVLDRSGAVRAMVGGKAYVPGGFNRATQAVRQPGSTIKPFVYLAAFDRGLTPETMADDAPITIRNWSPRNADGRFRGIVSLRTALIHSINTVPVRIYQQIGAAPILAMCARFGIPQDDEGPSLVLGSGAVTLLDLTAAYAALANGGVGVWPHGVDSVRDRGGQIVDRPAGGGPGRVADAAAVSEVVGILAQVLVEGTGRNARLPFAAAGKTGTTQDGRDAWFVGFTDRYVAGVWLGNDDNSPMAKVGGGTLPARIWRDVMTDLHR